MSERKASVFMKHNAVYVKDKVFEFESDEMMVLEMPDTDKFEQFKLYDSEYMSDIKLIKYKLCKDAKACVFFFLKRNTDKYDDVEDGE